MSQNIVVIKLITGEEVIGRLENESDTTITISKARVIQMVQTGPQAMGMAMVPYLASNIDGDIEFVRTAVIVGPIEPSDEAGKPYLQQTTSIALA